MPGGEKILFDVWHNWFRKLVRIAFPWICITSRSMASKSRLLASFRLISERHATFQPSLTTRSALGSIPTSIGSTSTPKAPLAASQLTVKCKPSTSSDVVELPNFDFCCRRANTRCSGVRAGPLVICDLEKCSVIATVKVPPKSGIWGRWRPGTGGIGERLR